MVQMTDTDFERFKQVIGPTKKHDKQLRRQASNLLLLIELLTRQ